MAGKQISVFNSISFRVPVIIVGILLIGIGITISYYLRSQNATIIDTKENEIHQDPYFDKNIKGIFRDYLFTKYAK